MTKNEAAAKAISDTCDKLKELLLSKNAAYGNSAFDPVRCFSKADPKEQIKVRMDDKLSRLMRGDDAGEDPFWDLAGYIILERSFDQYQDLAFGIGSTSKDRILKVYPNAKCLPMISPVSGSNGLAIHTNHGVDGELVLFFVTKNEEEAWRFAFMQLQNEHLIGLE